MRYKHNGQTYSPEPADDEVRRQLRRIIDSPDFCASERNRRLLQHVVERSLQGLQTNGYEIGTQVFGRPATFNPTKDPIVRIEASKVRRDLERYYLTSGRNDRVRISLPKGRYHAVFSCETPANDVYDPVPRQLPAGSLSLLRAALRGWAGPQEEAAAEWTALSKKYPGFLPNPASCVALDALSGGDAVIRELLSEGIRRASFS